MRGSNAFVLGCVLAAAPLGGCSNNTEPTGVALTVSLSTPNDDDGAVLLTISGGPVDSVETVGFSVHTARRGSETVSLIVSGHLGSGAIARIHVPDSRQTSRYSAKIVQVATRVTYAQRDPVSYRVSLLP